MLGLFTVVTYVEQRLLVLPNTAGKKELYDFKLYQNYITITFVK